MNFNDKIAVYKSQPSDDGVTLAEIEITPVYGDQIVSGLSNDVEMLRVSAEKFRLVAELAINKVFVTKVDAENCPLCMRYDGVRCTVSYSASESAVRQRARVRKWGDHWKSPLDIYDDVPPDGVCPIAYKVKDSNCRRTRYYETARLLEELNVRSTPLDISNAVHSAEMFARWLDQLADKLEADK